MAEVIKKEVTQVPKEAKGLSIAGMVLGICSIVLVVWLGFILGILAIIFSAIGLKRKKNGIALAGLITGIIGTILSVIIGVVFIIFVAYAGIQESAHQSALKTDAVTVQTEAEQFSTMNSGVYPSFDEMQQQLDHDGYSITIDKQGTNSNGDIIYIPCYGKGSIVWYWNQNTSEYQSLYSGDTGDCEWN